MKQERIPHKKVKIDGFIFDSKIEALRYKELLLLQKRFSKIFTKINIFMSHFMQKKGLNFAKYK